MGYTIVSMVLQPSFCCILPQVEKPPHSGCQMFIKATCASMNGVKDAMRTAVQMWKALSVDEQEVWNERCRALKGEYKKAMAAKGL